MPFNIRNSDGKFQVDDQGRFYFDDDCCCDTELSGYATYHCVSGTEGAASWSPGDFAGNLSGGLATDDYLWICRNFGSSNRWHPVYLSGLSVGAAAAYPVLEQCAVLPPTDCSHLSGWPTYDFLSGQPCSTGSISDTNFNLHWNNQQGYTNLLDMDTGELVVSGQLPAFARGTIGGAINSNNSGDFTLLFTISDWTNPTGGSLIHWEILVGVTTYYLGLGVPFSSTVVQSSVGNSGAITPAAENFFKIERIGSTITFYYDIGSGWVSLGTASNSGDITSWNMDWSGPLASSFWAKVYDVELYTTSGNYMYYNPTQLADTYAGCT